jgi:hypothetical protein
MRGRHSEKRPARAKAHRPASQIYRRVWNPPSFVEISLGAPEDLQKRVLIGLDWQRLGQERALQPLVEAINMDETKAMLEVSLPPPSGDPLLVLKRTKKNLCAHRYAARIHNRIST